MAACRDLGPGILISGRTRGSRSGLLGPFHQAQPRGLLRRRCTSADGIAPAAPQPRAPTQIGPFSSCQGLISFSKVATARADLDQICGGRAAICEPGPRQRPRGSARCHPGVAVFLIFINRSRRGRWRAGAPSAATSDCQSRDC